MDLSLNNELPRYDATKDKYLESYFQSPTVQSHLRSVGLMSKDGRVITDEEFKRAAIRRQQRWAARQHMAQMAVLQKRDFQLGRQLELRKQLDAVQKIESYRKVKGVDSGHELVHIEPLDLEMSLNRSHSAPGLRMFRSSSVPIPTSSPEQVLHSSGYQTDDDRPKSMPHTQGSNQSSRARSLTRRYLSDQYRFQYLHKLDNSSLEDYEGHLRRQLMQIEKFRRRLQNYYSFDDRLGMIPSINNNFSQGPFDVGSADFRRRSLSNSNNSSARWNHLRFSRTPKRARSISPSPEKKLAMQKHMFVTSAAARKRRQLQPSCECFLQYLGPSNNASGNQVPISITQQPSGGNNIVVFKEDLSPKAKFQFVSYRQKGFPFSLTISEDNRVIQTTSTCCESRYVVGSKLGGKQGFFKWLGVKNAVPCYKCQVHRGLQAPFTNFGQLKKKVKRLKKKPSEEEGVEQNGAAMNNNEAQDSDSESKKEMFITSAKPPRPRSARSKSIGSISSAVGAATGVGAGVAVASTLAAIEDQDEGLHSKVPSEHGSSLQASSDEGEGSDKEDQKSASSRKSTASRKSSARKETHGEDDFFDSNEPKEESTENQSHHTSQSSASESESSSGEESDESKGEEQKHDHHHGGKWGLEKENSLENKDIAGHAEGTDTTDNANNHSENEENKDDNENQITEHESERKEEENKEEHTNGSRSNSSSGSDSEAESNKLEQSEAKSMKSSYSRSRRSSTSTKSKSRKSSTQEEEDLRKQSMIAVTSKEPDDESTREEAEDKIQATEAAEANQTTVNETEQKPPPESESESESASSLSDSESEEESVSKALDEPNKEDSFADKLKEAGTATLLAEGNTEANGGGETVVLVDVHQNKTGGVDNTPWICNECNFDNDGDENECRICGAARDGGPAEPVSDNQNANEEETNERKEEEAEADLRSNKEEDDEGGHQSESESESESTTKPDNELVNNDDNKPGSGLIEEPELEKWTCKFCATVNEPSAKICGTCLLPGEYARPKTGLVVSDSTGSDLTSEEHNPKPEGLTDHEPEKNDDGIDTDAGEGHQLERDEEAKSATENNLSQNSRRSSYQSVHDGDTLADARSIKSNADHDGTHLIPPDIEIQPPSPSIANSSKIAETPRSQEIVAEIKKIDVNQALSYLKEFSAEDIHQMQSGTEENVETENNNPNPITDANDNDSRASVESGPAIEYVEGLPDDLVEDLQKPEAVLHNIELDASQVDKVASLLMQNENLNSLTIKSAKFTEQSLEIIANALNDRQPNLRVLNLNVNLLTPQAVPILRNLLKNHPIEILSLHDNQLNDDGITYLVSNLISLQENGGTKLRRLDIGENEISTNSAKRLGEYLASNDQLQSLIISGSSKIDDEGWKAVADGLASNNSLQALRLDYCQLGDANMELICNALKGKTELTTLDIDGNNVNEKGANDVVELVRSCPNIKNVIWMAGNNISTDQLHRVEQIISGRQHPEEKDHLSLSATHYSK